jgi:cbb3-type cytochrome oxidase subunit 3
VGGDAVIRIPYLREAGVLVLAALFIAYSVWLYRDGGKAARLDCAQRENRELQAQRAEIERLQKEAFDRDEALRKALSAPKAAPTIQKVIRANPSPCVVPAPVANGLRDAIRAGNKALSE